MTRIEISRLRYSMSSIFISRNHDAMAIVQRSGKPDFFLTCNPKWEEIKAALLDGEKPHHRPDLLARVFK